MSTFVDGLVNTLKVDIAMFPNNELTMNVLGDGGEENQEVRTLETDEETFEAMLSQEEYKELAWLESEIMDIVKATSILDQPMIRTFSVSESEPVWNLIDLERTPIDEGIAALMMASPAPPPPQKD